MGEGVHRVDAQLLDEVARCAGALRALGVTKGDTVVIYTSTGYVPPPPSTGNAGGNGGGNGNGNRGRGRGNGGGNGGGDDD